MKKIIVLLSCCFFFHLCSSQPVERCDKDDLLKYFPAEIVKEVLKNKTKLKEEQVVKIVAQLSNVDDEIDQIVQAKASKMQPNPFKRAGFRNVGLKIYQETVLEVFVKVLSAQESINEAEARELLEEIRLAKGKIFINCIKFSS